MKIAKYLALGGLIALAACGPAQVSQTANQAASAVGTTLPAGADATAAALASTALAAGVDQTAAAIANDPTVQALLGEALSTVQGLTPSDLKVDRNQKLVLDTTQQVAGVTDYRWIIVEAPKGAESVRGKMIGENSNGKLSVDPNDYSKYFPVAGNYTIDLELTYSDGKKERSPITISVP